MLMMTDLWTEVHICRRKMASDFSQANFSPFVSTYLTKNKCLISGIKIHHMCGAQKRVAEAPSSNF